MSDDGGHIGRRYYCAEAVIPIRSSPDESAEMISQLIYGDFAFLLAEEASWLHIRSEFDDYEGWVDKKMLSSIPSDMDMEQLEWSWVKQASLLHSSYKQPLPIGARVPRKPETTNQVWNPSGENISISHGSEFFEGKELDDPVSLAKAFMYAPYLWGGCSSFGIDCSGFTQRVFRMMGKRLPRDSRPQEKQGEEIAWGKHQAGDLAFFSKPNQFRITHVGIFIGEGEIIHASGRVRIDELTSSGIVHSDEHILTHELISIKR